MKRSAAECGFTLLESAVVVLVMGTVVAFSAPRISNAMREYHSDMAIRQIADTVHRAKTTAVADNRQSSLIIDTEANKMGLVVYDAAGKVSRIDYVSLPDGISFSMPEKASSPMDGAPADRSVSFPPQGKATTLFQQDFSSRGFPVVDTPGRVNAIYIGNGRHFRAITITCVGGIRTWWWKEGKWESARTEKAAQSPTSRTPK